MAYDTGIQNSRGGDCDTATSHKIMMNSRGFLGGVQAQLLRLLGLLHRQDEKGGMQRNYCVFECAQVTKLEDPEESGASQPVARCNASAHASEDPEGSRRLLGGDGAVRSSAISSMPAMRRHLSSRLVLQRHAPANMSPAKTLLSSTDGTMVFREENGDASADSARAPSTRRPAHAPHRAGRTRHPEKLRDEHLHRAQAEDEVHRQRLARF